ncbi:MAG: signal peptidase I [Clostridia bacterium]|jgi:signal peptidase I|nr:signal peptidase I [Clostridia bacterium]
MSTENEKTLEHMESVQAQAARALARAENAKAELTDIRNEITEQQSVDIFEDIKIPNIQDIASRLNQMEAEATPLATKENAAWVLVSQNQKKAAAAAAFMNQKERELNRVCQRLSQSQQNLKALEFWQNEAHRIAKQKAFTLAAAQKEAEDAYRTLNTAGENLGIAKKQVNADFQTMESTTSELSQACEKWQIAYNTWNDAKAEAEKNAAALKAIRKEIAKLIEDQEKAKTQAAEAVAQLALTSLKQNKELKDIDIKHLPAHNYAMPPANEFAEDTLQPKPTPPLKTEVYEPKEAKEQITKKSAEEFIPINPAKTSNTGFWQNNEPREAKEESLKNQKPAPALSTDNSKPAKKKNSFLSYLLCIALAVALALVIRTWGFQVTRVIGESMEPTLQTDNRVITSHLAYITGEPQAQDIITFPSPDTADNVPYIKRIIGVAGDHIKINEGLVYVNDTLLKEPYLVGMETLGDIDTIVPDGHVFVMGDNRMVSHDSRDSSVGFIAADTIMGKAVFRIYPFEQWGKVE